MYMYILFLTLRQTLWVLSTPQISEMVTSYFVAGGGMAPGGTKSGMANCLRVKVRVGAGVRVKIG